jgi:hypothetical protein
VLWMETGRKEGTGSARDALWFLLSLDTATRRGETLRDMNASLLLFSFCFLDGGGTENKYRSTQGIFFFLALVFFVGFVLLLDVDTTITYYNYYYYHIFVSCLRHKTHPTDRPTYSLINQPTYLSPSD